MKSLKITLVVMAAVMLTFGLSGIALALHAGGVAHCDACHTMHNSQDGVINANSGSIGVGLNSYLTKGSDPSSTCLNCHNGSGSYHINSTSGNNFTPGGDFFWLSKTYTGSHYNSPAESHGHNIIAADYSLTADPTLTTAPHRTGPGYNASWLGCNSCHDPHGKKDNNANTDPISGSGSYGDVAPSGAVLGNYRLMGGVGYDGGEQASGIAFAAGDPIARAPSFFAGGGKVSNTNHADYGSGMSEWCANCHGGFTADSSAVHRHPASDDAHLNGEAANYNSYVATGNVGGSSATSYDHLVPFERGITVSSALSTSSTIGPDTNSNVMCMTCHRPHGSAFSDIGRWDFNEELLADSPVLSSPEATNAYYGATITARYGQYQRSLCNKCHIQD